MARAIRLSVNPSNSAQYYVLYDDGQIDAVGGVPAITTPYRVRTSTDSPAMGLFVHWPLDSPPKGYVASQVGVVYSFGGAPGTATGSGLFAGRNQGRDLVMNPLVNGEGYVLGYKGRIIGIGGLTDLQPTAIYTDDVAWRLIVSWGASRPADKAWILSTHGGVASVNGAATVTPSFTVGNQDVFRAFVLNPGTANGYSMVGAGNIYKLGTEPAITRFGSWTGDVATDLVATSWSSPNTLMQLDQLGGVHFPRSSSVPTVSLTGPIGTVEDNAFPTVSWSYSDDDGDPQGWYRVWVYTLAQTQAAGFTPGTPAALLPGASGEASDIPPDLPPHVWNSGRVQASEPREVSVGAGLENRYPVEGGTATVTPLGSGTYKAYVEVWDATGQYSGVSVPLQWVQSVDPGAAPVGEVIQFGSAAVLRVQQPDNMHTRQQADFESTTDPIGWSNDTNAGTPVRSTTYASNKTASMRITSSTSGTMRVKLTNALDVSPNTTYTVWADLRSGSTDRDVRIVWQELNASGGTVTTKNSAYSNEADKSPTTTTFPPTAALTVDDTTPLSGQRITLNGSSSSDPTGLALTYQWLQDQGPSIGGFTDTGGGNQRSVYATMPTVTDYTIVSGRLIVTNSDGLSDATSWSVTVGPTVAPTTKPIAFLEVAGAGATPLPGNTVDFNAAQSYDPAGRGPLTYRFQVTSGSPSFTLTAQPGPFGAFVKQGVMPSASSYPNPYGVTVWVTSADGVESDPAAVIVSVQDPTPGGPITTPTGGVKNLKRAIMFTSNIDAPERYKRLGRVPDWEFKYCSADTFANLVSSFKSNTSGLSATTRRIVDFSFTTPKDPGSPRLPNAANGDYDSYYDEIALAVSNLTSTQINNLIINMSHEHTGGWYSWGVRYTDGSGTNALPAGATLNTRMQQFKDVWRRVVGKINSKCAAAGKPRPRYSINYTSNTGTFQQDLVLGTYPGDAYVDIITLDIYSHDAFATESNLQTWLSWFGGFLSGKTRRNDAGTAITGAPKLFGINEYAMHMKSTGDVRNNRAGKVVGDASWFFKDIFDFAEGLIATSGLHHLAMFETSPGTENKYHAAVDFVTTGTASDYGRAMLVTDVAKIAAGVLGCQAGQPGPGSFSGYAAVGSTARVNYTCGAPVALNYWMNRVGGPYKAGE